jgi:hypothetical protein
MHDKAGDILTEVKGPKGDESNPFQRIIDAATKSLEEQLREVSKRLREGGVGGGGRPDEDE